MSSTENGNYQSNKSIATEGSHPMAHPDELEALTKAFSGHGIDEKSLITILGQSHPQKRQAFRKSTPHLFKEDERQFERWDDNRVKLLKHEFMRFKNAIVMWAMHPWERDARLIKEALAKGSHSYNVIIEVACTRSSEDLLGARRAYHSLFDHSIEEDVASHVHGPERKLLVALVSAYRYEGPKVKEDTAKSEAKTLFEAIKSADKRNPIEDEEVIRILSTRSKPFLEVVYKQYEKISGGSLEQDLRVDVKLQETVYCLCAPERHFSQVLDSALKTDAHKSTKKALTRVVVTRADVDIKEIKEEFSRAYGVSLAEKIEQTANGSYKDLLLTLISKEA